MNKNLLAIAIASALAFPMSAAAEVKIIGQAQLELVSTSGDTVTEGISVDDGFEAGSAGSGNASAIGVTGTHDLGNGMTGLYKVNFNFQADDATRWSGRDQFIGLKGDFGTVLLGTMNTPYKSTTAKWDPFLATFLQARGSNGASLLHNGYAGNVLAYANKMGDANVVLAINFDESLSTTSATPEYQADHGFHFGVNAPIGDAMEVAVGYFDLGGTDESAVKVGLKWSSDDLTIAGQFEALDANTTSEGERNFIYLSASKALGGGASVALGVGNSTDESTGGSNDGSYVAVGYKKMLNKKVSWHAGFKSMDEGRISGAESASQVGAGVRVKF